MDKNVPELGDEETFWEEVSRFYDFWYTFRSWREFPHPDEEDTSQAESREHKRWIERQNMKLREKAKKGEGKRIREFVESAFRLDPRVAQHKEAEKQARLVFDSTDNLQLAAGFKRKKRNLRQGRKPRLLKGKE